PQSVAMGDLNGDGKLDLATANSGSDNVSVLFNTCAGCTSPGFSSPANYSVGTGPYLIAEADYNRDGNLDLAVANFNSGTVSILLGNSNGTFGSPTNFAVGSGPASIAEGDFNSDGKLDLVTANQNSGNISILLGNGSGGFGTATNITIAGQP